MLNYQETMRKHKGRAFMHMQDEFMIRVLTESLEFCNNNLYLASDTLGISHQTFKSWCEKLGVSTGSRDYIHSENLNEKEVLIKRALIKYGSITQAARSLNVSRITLFRWMKKLGIEK